MVSHCEKRFLSSPVRHKPCREDDKHLKEGALVIRGQNQLSFAIINNHMCDD